MTILNYTEYQALVDSTVYPNGQQEVTAAGLAEVLTSVKDSTRTYFNGITGGSDTFGVSGTAAKIATFDTNIGNDSQLLVADAANSRMLIQEPGSYEVLADVTGEWGNSNDLYIQGFLNGAAVPFFGPRWQNGEGAGNPVSVDWRATVQVSTATPMAPAVLELYTAGNSSFTVTQLGVAIGIGYLPWTIRNP